MCLLFFYFFQWRDALAKSPFLQVLRDNVLGEFVAAILLAVGIIFWRRRRQILGRLRFFPGALVCVGENQKYFQDTLLSTFAEAKELRLMVIRGLAILGLRDALFHKMLADKRGSNFKMRVLLLDPRSQYVAKRAAEIGETSAAMTTGITYSLNEILELKQQYGLNLEVRLYNALPIWRLIFLDEKLFLSSYLDRMDGYDTPMHMMEKNERSLYNVFSRHFESVWDIAKLPQAKDVFTADDAVQLMRSFGCDDALVWHCKTVSRIAISIAENAMREHRDLDLHLIEIGSLLHDIGKARTKKLDHAYRGADHIRSASRAIPNAEFREKVARVVERHVGAGLTREEVETINREQRINIPLMDYVPESLEEIIVAVADKMVEGNHEKTFDQQLSEKIKKFGENSQVVKRLQSWQERLTPYLR